MGSEWCRPIVIVPKSDGKIRICGDFINIINPITENAIFTNIANGKVFLVIDLKNAYFQLKVSEESKHLLTINTPLVSFRYKILAFGVKTYFSISN